MLRSRSSFLEDTLGYDVDNEKDFRGWGEDRTLSNIASGYLAEGEDRILSNIALDIWRTA